MDDHATEPTQRQSGESNQRDTLREVKRLMAAAEAHERRVALREESAQFLDERGESEGAEKKRREADLERDAARTAWDRAMALQGPTQMTEKGLEIPIPTRGEFLRNIEKVVPRAGRPDGTSSVD
jgi:DnaJ-domain-containing protein 1